MSVGSGCPFSSVTGLTVTSGFTVVVGVRSSPLDVNPIPILDCQVIWHKVVLDGRESLDNVTSFPSDVQVVKLRAASQAGSQGSWVLSHVNDVTTVLESSTELSGVDGKLQTLVRNVDINCGVLCHWGVNTVPRIVVSR